MFSFLWKSKKDKSINIYIKSVQKFKILSVIMEIFNQIWAILSCRVYYLWFVLPVADPSIALSSKKLDGDGVAPPAAPAAPAAAAAVAPAAALPPLFFFFFFLSMREKSEFSEVR